MHANARRQSFWLRLSGFLVLVLICSRFLSWGGRAEYVGQGHIPTSVVHNPGSANAQVKATSAQSSTLNHQVLENLEQLSPLHTPGLQ